ncbi:hypothetical protein [Noviherbaspirillum malthae]|uniref:hypothetical protein n=1 Tax=Noviherbaspirillum malthae TaxID=1260987 RepID=UPI00188E5AE6|nr:hypothetical protein [Noviherbaspirillum malthae]
MIEVKKCRIGDSRDSIADPSLDVITGSNGCFKIHGLRWFLCRIKKKQTACLLKRKVFSMHPEPGAGFRYLRKWHRSTGTIQNWL